MNEIITSRLRLSLAHEINYLRLKEFEQRNVDHLAPWETIVKDVSDDVYKNRLSLWEKEFEEGRAVRFFLFLNDDSSEQLIGMCNFSNIIRGPFQACYLGYKIDYAYEGKGLMTEALKAAVDHMFGECNLHRIMANYMPTNIKSGQLLARLGFTVEGEAKQYLFINGKWEDHIMTSLINKNWKA